MKKGLWVLFLMIAVLGKAQNGSIRGKVIDRSTGEELIGATIFAVGTTRGTVTDFDGNYVLENLKAGMYSIQCSFISYETVVIDELEIKDGEEKVLNVQLGSATLGLEEVTIEAREIKRTENAVMALQKKAANLVDGISAQQISRMGDSDAASSLKRVTGVSVQDGKYVYVRGLSDRYSKTLLNGAEIPGLDPNKNSVQMDLFPGSLIENMIVNKSFNPELPGSFTGGLVNLVTKDFPEKYTVQYAISVGYNPQVNLRADFLGYAGGKFDFLGMDDGMRAIPVDVEDIPYYPTEKDKLDEITRSFNKVMTPKEQTSLLNQSHNLAIGNQFDFKGKQLGFIAGLSYSNNYQYYDQGIKALYKRTSLENESLNKEQFYTDRQGKNEVLLGMLLNVSLKLSNHSKIGLSLIRNQGGESVARYLSGSKNSDEIGMIVQTRVLHYLERSLNTAQLRGEHKLTDFNDLKINWLSAFTFSAQNEPDLRFFTNSYYPGNGEGAQYAIEPSKYKLPARYYRNMKEFNSDNKVNFSLPVGILGAQSQFKFGAAYLFKYRTFNDQRVDYHFQFSGDYFNGQIEDFLADQNIGQSAQSYLENGRYGIYIQNGTDEKNSYTAQQHVGAAYALLDYPVSERLRIITGLRFENTHVDVASLDESKSPGFLNNQDLLPALNVTYRLVENMNLRFAASRTLARPSFRELAPFASEDFAGGEVRIGNPELKRTLIDNLDLRWEYYFNAGEMISVSAFYKNFHDPIEVVDNPIAVNTEFTWRNVEQAQVRGIEAEVRKQLDFFPVLHNFKLGANFTWVHSQVNIDSLELAGMPPGSDNTRSMFGQAPYILNALLVYSDNKAQTEASLGYNLSGDKLVVVVKGITPDIVQKSRGQLDFKLTRKIGTHISISFKANNLLNTDYIEKYNVDSDQDYLYKKYSIGRTYAVGFSYKIS